MQPSLKMQAKIYEDVYRLISTQMLPSLKNPTGTLVNIEKSLEEKKITNQQEIEKFFKRKQKFSDFEQRITIAHDSDIPPMFTLMLTKIIKENVVEAPRFTIVNVGDSTMDNSLHSGINLDSQFIQKLSLEAREAWCIYVVNVAINTDPYSMNHTKIIDKELFKKKINIPLFIKQALKSKEDAQRCITCMKELPEDMLPLDLFKDIIAIDETYKTIEWLKKYAL